MPDVRGLAPAAWGLAAALAWDFCMMIAAFRTPGAAAGARTAALLNLALGCFIGPLAALVFTGGVLFLVPPLDPKAVEVDAGRDLRPPASRASRSGLNASTPALLELRW